jgi:hypothetical protein
MEKIVSILMAMRDFYQSAHSLSMGDHFFGDHDFFGEARDLAHSDVDGLIELWIAETGSNGFVEKLDTAPYVDKYDFNLKEALVFEEFLHEEIEAFSKGKCLAVQTVLGDVDSKHYKIRYKLLARLGRLK